MNRRDFLAASAVAGVAPLARLEATDRGQQAGREILELRRYHMIAGAQTRAMGTYFEQALIPALNRAGVTPVGTFSVVYGENGPSMVLLLTHKSLESVAGLRDRLAADAEYQKAGAAVLQAPMSDPAFVRVESSLMRAFAFAPKLEVPAAAATKATRIFELRRYESHSDAAALRKIEMFGAGEIPIFRRTGLTPVFFAETLVGTDMPNLTYMLTFPDMAARDVAWAAFQADPDWKKLAANPYYAETVSAISDVILRPTAYSQI